MLWIDVDTALASVPVNSMPLIDDTDFKTIEDAVVYNQAGLALFWNFTTTAGVTTVTAVTPTSGGDYDWTDFTTSGKYGIEIPASGGASANNDTEGFGYFTGVATGILPWKGPTMGFRAAGLNNILIDSAYSATRALAGTALPDAVADAAGGLVISDAGGLDIDTKLANTNEITVARMGALTDWINGGRLDLLLDAIKVVTDAQTAIAPATLVDLIWDEPLTGATHNVATSSGKRLRQIDAAFEITSGTAVAGSTSTTLNLNSADGADVTTDEIYAGDRVVIIAGVGIGEHGLILSYDASTQIATMSKPWVITPDNTSEYILSPADVDVELWNDNTVTGDGDWASLNSKSTSILSDTNELQTDWTNGGRLDLILDIVAVDTTTDIPALIATAQADLDIITDSDGVILGATGVDLIWDELLTGGTHNVTNSSGKIVRELRELGAYAGGGIWYDSINGTAGSDPFENGTINVPVDNESDLRSLIASTGYNRVFVAPGSSLTMAGTYTNTAFIGRNWTLALGGQVATGLVCEGAVITGTMSSGSLVRIENCSIGAATMPAGKFVGCGIGSASGTFTAAAAGQYILDKCYSEVPGTGSPDFIFSGLGSTTGINNRGWLGGATYTLDTDCTLSHEVLAGGGTTVTTGGGDVEIRGITRSVTLTLGTGTSETVQFVGTTGPITISGSPTAAVVNLYGVSNGLTDTSSGSTVTNETVNLTSITADVLTTQMTESYAADGTAPNMTQALMLIQQMLTDFAISGTTNTVKKLDGSTTAATMTLDSATAPTSSTRAT